MADAQTEVSKELFRTIIEVQIAIFTWIFKPTTLFFMRS